MNSSEKLENENVAVELEQNENAIAEAKKAEQIVENIETVEPTENTEEIVHADKNENGSTVYATMLTTIDNPFDPFDQFDDWFRYDEEKGYHTCSYLGRIIVDSDQLSDEELREATEEAIDQILQYDFMNIYKKVRKPVMELDSSEN